MIGMIKNVVEAIRRTDDRSLEFLVGTARRISAGIVLFLTAFITRCSNVAVENPNGISFTHAALLATTIATISASLVALLQSAPQRSGNTRLPARDLGSVWLGTFVLVILLMLANDFTKRLPKEVETPWMRNSAPFPNAKSCYKLCSDSRNSACTIVDRDGKIC
jgi:hypothetical protein